MTNLSDINNIQKQKSFRVRIFHLYTLHKFFDISCSNCKMRKVCEPVNYKREFCAAANDTEKLFCDIAYGRVYSFTSDDFFVYGHEKSLKRRMVFVRRLAQIQDKYLVEQQNVR